MEAEEREVQVRNLRTDSVGKSVDNLLPCPQVVDPHGNIAFDQLQGTTAFATPRQHYVFQSDPTIPLSNVRTPQKIAPVPSISAPARRANTPSISANNPVPMSHMYSLSIHSH
jgi:hypothetical protein